MVSLAEVLEAISDEKSPKLFAAIAANSGKSGDLSVQSKLSHKEFYSRLLRFIKVGMVKRKRRVYFSLCIRQGGL